MHGSGGVTGYAHGVAAGEAEGVALWAFAFSLKTISSRTIMTTVRTKTAVASTIRRRREEIIGVGRVDSRTDDRWSSEPPGTE